MRSPRWCLALCGRAGANAGRRQTTQEPLTVRFVSDFADAAVILPLVGLLWPVLGRAGTRWVLACMLTLGGILLLKAVCFRLTGPWPFSPSGHTASAAIVYGGLAWVLLRPRLGRAVPALLAVAAVGLIGWTRLQLGAHSVAEVAAGAAIGAAGFAWLAWRTPELSRMWPVMAVTVLVWTALHGQSLGIEEWLRGAVSGR